MRRSKPLDAVPGGAPERRGTVDQRSYVLGDGTGRGRRFSSTVDADVDFETNATFSSPRLSSSGVRNIVR